MKLTCDQCVKQNTEACTFGYSSAYENFYPELCQDLVTTEENNDWKEKE